MRVSQVGRGPGAVAVVLVVLGAAGTGCAAQPFRDPGAPRAVLVHHEPRDGQDPQNAQEQAQNIDDGPAEDASIERLTLSAGRWTFRDVRVEGTRLWGPEHELAHFEDGYRGDSPSGFVFLSDHGTGTVSGTIGNGALTSFQYDSDPSTGRVHAKGRWAWKAFGLDLDHDTITVTRRFCTDTYHRRENSNVFVGNPECWQAGNLGAVLRVPESFFARPPTEQIVFLTTFLI